MGKSEPEAKSAILIRQALLEGRRTDVLIEGNRFARIAPDIENTGAYVIEADGKAILPPFYNGHGHAAMTLMRGFADDTPLFPWLRNHIWPAEKLLTDEDVEWGTRLAIIEMIRSGTVFFNDMYWYPSAIARAVEDMGVRAAIGRLFIEESPGKVRPACQAESDKLDTLAPSLSDRIQVTYAPHAIYTVSGTTLRRIVEEHSQSGEMIHIHAAETMIEMEDSVREHGMTPVAWLDKCGILGPRTVLAHCVYLTDEDIKLIRERDAIISHNPNANAKLCSGRFRFHDAVTQAGCRTVIGTDGCASNNNLSMFDEMKAAAMSAKIESGRADVGKAEQLYHCATAAGAEAFGVDAGAIAVGKLADAILVNLDHPALCPGYNLISDLVYAADTSCVDSVVCDGRILMEHGRIDGQEAVLEKVRSLAAKFREFSKQAALSD